MLSTPRQKNLSGIFRATPIEARATRDALVRIERERGRTIYAIAQELGVSQNAVRRMLGLRKSPPV